MYLKYHGSRVKYIFLQFYTITSAKILRLGGNRCHPPSLGPPLFSVIHRYAHARTAHAREQWAGERRAKNTRNVQT